MRDLPVACTLSQAEFGARRGDLLPGLISLATVRLSLDDGYRLTFAPAPGLLETIARVVDAERQCCRFLRFQLVVDQDGAPITLDVTGPHGTREFLTDLIGIGGTDRLRQGYGGLPKRNATVEVPPYVPSSRDARQSAESA